MEFAKITAIVRPECLQRVEGRLQALGVPGMTVSQVRGFGDYADLYRSDWMVSHVRIEIYTRAADAEHLAEQIMETAHTGLEGDGLVAIEPVAALYHIRLRKRCRDEAC